ncbi:MAG: NFACT family protein [Anaerolineae bacterium]|nr:NFACT family protein [Anaerolineae bacterium]NUQ02279.1 fibronectin/fibrinogen-binding protein [Anaerolineae bacterium]
MPLDVFALSALVDEFLDVLVGGRVQDSVCIDSDTLGLEIYANHRRQYLLLSADAQRPRVHLVGDKLRRGLERPTPLGLLIRSQVEGGKIAHVSQPPWERVLQFDIDGPEGLVSLIIEPMERRSNVLLVKGGIILDCVRRVGPEDNRVRLSLPAHQYVPPPPQTGKISPFMLVQDELNSLFEQARQEAPSKRKAHQVLTSGLLGISPLLAKEILYCAAGDSNADIRNVDTEALMRALVQVMDPLKRRQWTPGVVEEDGVTTDFSAYHLTWQPGWHTVGSINEAMAMFFGAPVGEEAYEAAKLPVREAIRAAHLRLETKLASLRRSLTDDAERETLRQSGELILAYQYAIRPGQAELRAPYEVEASDLVIALEPSLTPVENALRYFERYSRAKRALEDIPGLIAEVESEIAYLQQMAADIDLAASWPDIEEVQTNLHASGYWQGRPIRRTGSKTAPLRVVTPDGFIIWIGRNSRQNEQVTFDKGGPVDLWLHARGVAGAHVIVKNDGRRIPDAVLETAASLAAYYSAGRQEGKVMVDVTERRHVRKIKGGRPGMVTYRNEVTRTASPRPASDFVR